jgi:hypothetical protein
VLSPVRIFGLAQLVKDPHAPILPAVAIPTFADMRSTAKGDIVSRGLWD